MDNIQSVKAISVPIGNTYKKYRFIVGSGLFLKGRTVVLYGQDPENMNASTGNRHDVIEEITYIHVDGDAVLVGVFGNGEYRFSLTNGDWNALQFGFKS